MSIPTPPATDEGFARPQSIGRRETGLSEIRLSEVISALSYVLDLTEGQPTGHAVRSCFIGMRLGSELKLGAQQLSALFYALLLKDAGCSSNAGRVCTLFGADDRTVKRNLKTVDWSRISKSLGYITTNASPNGSPTQRALRMLQIAFEGRRGAKKLVQIRCERGEEIARMLDLPDEAARAIRALDEHWDGRGYPEGIAGENIPLLARVLGLAQTVEVFFTAYGLGGAFDMLQERKGTWFDPALVEAFMPVRTDRAFWQRLKYDDLQEHIANLEPPDRVVVADDAQVDRIAEAFAKVVDAKSPWTYRHSEKVAELAVGIGEVLSLPHRESRNLRRAALLHDIGKLGVSNLILDKPGPLTAEERSEMNQHADKTREILERVNCFREVAELASSHHERLDGSGYAKGLKGDAISRATRILAIADVYDALTSDRPYRSGSTREEALEIIRQDVGTLLCPTVFGALAVFLDRR